MQEKIKEIGSIFHEISDVDEICQNLQSQKVMFNESFNYYYSGRNALLAILQNITKNIIINKIWLPKYYCDTVITLINKNYKNVDYYDIDPFDPFSSIDSKKFASKNDVVIINNYWGLSKLLKVYKSGINVVEDHTHGWLSEQCINSNANYCFASLRKSYPIALGAVAWQPKHNKQFDFSDNNKDQSIIKAYHSINTAMQLKKEYLKSNYTNKEEILKLSNEGEKYLNNSSGYINPNPEIIKKIKKTCFYDINLFKRQNLQNILPLINFNKKFKIIEKKGFTPFGLLIVLDNHKNFISLKKHLIINKIFPANLWPNIILSQKWKYLLNIHVDFRYEKSDMEYIAKIINNWSQSRH